MSVIKSVEHMLSWMQSNQIFISHKFLFHDETRKSLPPKKVSFIPSLTSFLFYSFLFYSFLLQIFRPNITPKNAWKRYQIQSQSLALASSNFPKWVYFNLSTKIRSVASFSRLSGYPSNLFLTPRSFTSSLNHFTLYPYGTSGPPQPI